MKDKIPVLLGLDDDQEICEIVQGIGEQAGFAVTMKTSAGPFQEMLRLLEPDVIMLDLQMSGMDGVQVLRFLADQGVKAGILLMSGMDERTIASAEQYALSRGLRVLNTLQKPFLPEEMLEKLLFAKAATESLTAADLRKAIDRNELLVYYQPTLRRFADGSWDVATMEALVRWNHPERGVLAPNAFIEMSERQGLSRAITDFVTQTGVEQLKSWHAAKLNIGLRVNVPATLITDIDFPDRLEAILVAHEIDPADLTIEITETATLDRHSDTFDILTRLRVKNINLAIDDFGIGYSSLTQLFQMPFNEMKIDKSLVLRVPQSKEARIMIDALVELAHKLNLTVCAEGVESEETLDFLTTVGCDSAQGFFISPPIAAAKVPDVVRGWDAQQKRSQQRRLTGS
ncbi:MAG TPA: EAL domain-containing response regulator [Gammaproteobacteria bacterium]|nr:EAL domain-containing response regulator [Gammaproteobacteria bacterium]